MIKRILDEEECIYPLSYTLDELKDDIYTHLEVVPGSLPLSKYSKYEESDDVFINYEIADEVTFEIYDIDINIEDDSAVVTCDCDTVGFCSHMAGALMLFGLEKENQKYVFKEVKNSIFPASNTNKKSALDKLNVHNRKKIVSQLTSYGFDVNDNWEKHFTIVSDWRDTNLVPKNQNIVTTEYLSSLGKSVTFQEKKIQLPSNLIANNKEKKKAGIVWVVDGEDVWPSAHLIVGKTKKNGDLGAPINTFARSDVAYSFGRNPLPRNIEELGMKITAFSLETFLSARNEYRLNAENTFKYIKEAYYMMREVMDEMMQHSQYIINDDDFYRIKISDLKPVQFKEKDKLTFKLFQRNGFYTLKPQIYIDGKKHAITQIVGFGMVNVDEYILPLTFDEALFIANLPSNEGIKIKENFKAELLPMVLELQKQFEVEFSGIDLSHKEEDLMFEKRKLYLTEEDDYLLLQPAVKYTHPQIGEKEYGLDDRKVDSIQINDEEVLLVHRDLEKENTFQKFINALHPSFENQENHFKYLHSEEVLKEQWFIKIYAQLEEEGVEVLGRKSLKKIKLNPNKPIVRLSASSGMDWFDLEMKVSFGDQIAKLADIRKAIVNRQDYVTLGDGSKGFLPKEWLDKYSNLLKLGKLKKDNLRISAYQPSLIDELYDEMQNKEVFDEILQKQKNLKNFRKMPEVTLPKNVNATLRPYQKEGFKWLTFLDKIQWGGCLADDMGLGKTLQVLTFLQYLKEQNKNKKELPHLIVVPRSLVFNWQRETEKFCSDLSILDNSHADRTKDIKEYKKYDAVIMTYAMVRLDIETLKKAKFNYVILDESQAIKNPNAQVSKAVKLLKAQNRIVITGTPVENNTFDLFSQMDFLNPGMLGTVKSFKEQYADAIDKHRDVETAEELRKIIYPFMLRRKKNDVAKDLPKKVEQVLYCEMGAVQRKVYDTYKNKSREKILEVMETEGKQKAGMYIIQGLMKLRQICNSPALLSNDENGEMPQNSAKLDLLMEQVTELVAEGHKVLIFSFFVEMLGLIGNDLEKKKIDYCKLLGGSTNREELVNEFKQNEDKKVFLISLKAGGFGLNLTEASYVFLVDPWWNPAVEQQAIDRTHRIGQENPVFAYKMICKDSIEEKILEIQEKKKGVADDVISTESGFIKNISKDDIKVLFE